MGPAPSHFCSQLPEDAPSISAADSGQHRNCSVTARRAQKEQSVWSGTCQRVWSSKYTYIEHAAQNCYVVQQSHVTQ